MQKSLNRGRRSGSLDDSSSAPESAHSETEAAVGDMIVA
jgi:hypothetical protein